MKTILFGKKSHFWAKFFFIWYLSLHYYQATLSFFSDARKAWIMNESVISNDIPSTLVAILTNHGIRLKYNCLTWNEIWFKVFSWGYFSHFSVCSLLLSTGYSEAWFFVTVGPVVSVVRNTHCFSWWLWLKAIQKLAVKFPLRIAINPWFKVLRI